eukprot:Skav220543  [mRNA]  locus=scaffold761:18645:25351:- [translate_table: standard]
MTCSRPPSPGSCLLGGLSRLEVERYGRQVVLPSLGVEGQKQLLQGTEGEGGTGVGRIGLVDADTVQLSNLHRQIGHWQRNDGVNKDPAQPPGGAATTVSSDQQPAQSLAESCRALNPSVLLEVHRRRLSALDESCELVARHAAAPANHGSHGGRRGRTMGSVEMFVTGYSVVVDCTDAPPSRYLLNDAALRAGRPLVAASAVFPVSEADAEPVASCEEHGVLGPIVGTVGSLAALEAIKAGSHQRGWWMVDGEELGGWMVGCWWMVDPHGRWLLGW